MLLAVATFVSIVFGVWAMRVIFRKKRKPLEMSDGWWTSRDRPAVEDDEIRPFAISIQEEDLLDLKGRLSKTRWIAEFEDGRWLYGANLDYMKNLINYWQNEFDWHKQESILNQYDHFVTNIEGLDVHYIKVCPTDTNLRLKAKPLLMIHGWPGSFFEFYKIMPFLVDPLNHGGTEGDAFEVVCPSIPGYGFSQASEKQGLDIVVVARIFGKLMARLGFKSYFVQGGDWGSSVATTMANIDKHHVRGIHLNLYITLDSRFAFVRAFLSGLFPRLFGWLLKDSERKVFKPTFFDVMKKVVNGMGYFLLQSTKPHTPAYALNDSPAGLAAYIAEKFSSWSDGDEDQLVPFDDLLTNISIYWFTQTIGSSMRFYKENLTSRQARKASRMSVEVPTALATFPGEFFLVPVTWLHGHFPNIVQITEMPRGGHFAAMEEPELLAKDVRKFCQKIKEGQSNFE